MDNVLAEEEVRHVDAFRKDPVQDEHLGLGLDSTQRMSASLKL